MADAIRISFERHLLVLPLAMVLPLRKLQESVKGTSKYKRIAQSIAEVGVIEPLVVAPATDPPGAFLLLDGHVRFAILQERGETEARCLLADDDEAFTYNKRVNRLATVQEHYMIVRALERGVSEEKLARALNVDPKLIKRRRGLLDGICPEVVDLLKDRSVNPNTFDLLRKMKPMRQIEAAELMMSVNNFSSSYAKALLAGTRQADLARPDKAKRIGGLNSEQMARMEREMASLNQDFKALEASFGDDVLHLVIASGYLSRLIANSEIERYLQQRHPELLTEFRSIITAASLYQTNAAA
jgi:ParB-like chromosome segregation protein Spo0J